MGEDVHEVLRGLIGRAGVEAALERDALEALELVTVTEDGWPHVALLSAGEIAPLDGGGLGFCLWRSSTTVRNLARSRQGLLQAVRDGAVVKLALTFEPLGSLAVDGVELEGFTASAIRLDRDAVAYAEVLGSLRYRLTDVPGSVERWRRQLDALEAAAASGKAP